MARLMTGGICKVAPVTDLELTFAPHRNNLHICCCMQNLYLTDSHPLFPLAFHLILASPATSVRAKGNRFRISNHLRPHNIMESVGMREESK